MTQIANTTPNTTFFNFTETNGNNRIVNGNNIASIIPNTNNNGSIVTTNNGNTFTITENVNDVWNTVINNVNNTVAAGA